MSLLDTMAGFAQGLDPTAVRLRLGSFTFLDFEVPERIAFGARQQTVIHRLVGGKRTIDLLGEDWDAIQWSGIFTGSSTSARVQALERMRAAGKQVVLTLDDISFTVVLAEFIPVYEFAYKRPYSIKLEVVKRNDAPVYADALTASLDALINSDIGKALDLANIINVQAVTDAVTAVQSAVAAVSDIATATVDAVQTIVRPIIAAQVLIQQTIGKLEASATAITTLGGLIPGNPVSKAVNNVLTQVDLATRTPALYQLQDVLGRLNKNVTSGTTANGVQTVTLSGGNLYQVASDYYGDPSQWTVIAAANGLTDPQLTGIHTLTIPVIKS